MMLPVMFALTIGSAHGITWREFCERNLVADDPYQYENLTVDQIVDLWLAHERQGFRQQALRAEIRHRLHGNLTHEEREMLKVTGVRK